MHDREKVISGLEFTKAMMTFNPSTGEDIEPENLNEANKTSYDACVGALALLKEQEAVRITTDYFDWFGNRTSHRPSCNSRLVWHQNKNYCGECGRSVKWE